MNITRTIISAIVHNITVFVARALSDYFLTHLKAEGYCNKLKLVSVSPR